LCGVLSYSNKLHRGGVFVWGNWGDVWGVLGVGNLGCRGQSFFWKLGFNSLTNNFNLKMCMFMGVKKKSVYVFMWMEKNCDNSKFEYAQQPFMYLKFHWKNEMKLESISTLTNKLMKNFNAYSFVLFFSKICLIGILV
jgi:hypothetical protein